MEKFDHIVYEPLRNWNRCVMMFNINEDQGIDAASAYLKQFSKEDMSGMLDMYHRVKTLGAEEVKRQLIVSMPLQEDEEAAVE